MKLASDKVGTFLVQMLVEDDVVHGLGEVGIDLVQKRGCVCGTLASEGLRVLSHRQDAIDLVVVNFRDLVLWHVLNIVTVLDKSVGIDTVLIGALEALDELFGLFLVKNDEDTSKTGLQLGDFPDTLVTLRFRQVLKKSELAPIAELILVLPKTVCTNTLGGDHAGSVAAEPVLGQTSVIVHVIEGLKGQPTAWNLVWVPELGIGGNQVIADVHILVLTLGFLLAGRVHFGGPVLIS